MIFNRADKLKPLAADHIQRTVRRSIEDARSFIAADIAPDREEADAYYRGATAVKSVKGRSQVTVTRVRDAVKSVLPSLGRIFTQSDTIAQFESDEEMDEKQCAQQTLFVNQVFHKFGGYSALIQACTDALKAKVGVVKVTLERTKVATHRFEDFITPDQMQMLMTDETQQVTEATPPMPSPDGQGEVYGVVLTKQSFRNRWFLDPVKPESFFISRGAKSIADARIVGTAENMDAWEVIDKLGLTLAEIRDADRDPDLDMEARERTQIDPAADEDNGDEFSREVLVTECWMRLDADGDGVAELRHLITVGTGYRIVLDEPANCVQLAAFSAELQPHQFFPICLAEDLEQDQDAQTALLRSIIDNAGMVNSPRTAVVEDQVNLVDVQNGEIGSIIRVKVPGMIEELTTPFVAGATLPVLQYLEAISEQRSGVTKISQGLSSDVLQSTAKEAAGAMVQGSDARIEMMARNLAETGVKELFLTILRVAMYDMKGPQSVKTATGYEEVRPDMWHDQVAVRVNVGMGNGRVGEKIMALDGVAQVQMQAMQQLGLNNPIAGWEQFRKAQVDKMKLLGITNATDYLPIVSEQILGQLAQQQAQAAQKGPPDPTAGLVEAEKVKGQVKLQTSQAELQLKGQIEQAKLQVQLASDMERARMEDDRERDIAYQQYAVDAHEAQLGAAERAIVGVENARNRQPPGQTGGQPRGQQPQQPPPGPPAGPPQGMQPGGPPQGLPPGGPPQGPPPGPPPGMPPGGPMR